MAVPLSPEAELLLLLVSTRRRRSERRERLLELIEQIDYAKLATLAGAQRLPALVGTRLEETGHADPPEWFREAAGKALERDRVLGLLLERVTLDLVDGLRDRGVGVLVLKGPGLGERLYGDAGLRPSRDVDLLVAPEDFDRAIRALKERGYSHARVDGWIGALPLFETSLTALKPTLPPIDLHWRVHWYEDAFSRELLEHTPDDHRGLPVPAPLDEFATMLLMHARDGFLGVRGAADAAAWWDARSPNGDRPVLDELASSHEALQPALATTAVLFDQLVGIPSSRLLGESGREAYRSLPLRFQNHSLWGSDVQRDAVMKLVDWFLTPRGGRGDYVRRHIVLPPAVVAEAYGREPREGWRGRLLQLRYAVVMIARLSVAWSSVVWRIRGGARVRAFAG